MRLISIDALLRLMQLKQSLDDPDALRKIHEILIPRDFTRLDGIVDLMFSTANDAEQVPEPETADRAEGAPKSAPERKQKATPVAFNDSVAHAVGKHLELSLLRRTRALYSTSDDDVQVLCAASRRYADGDGHGYWFAFHHHQRTAIEAAKRGYVSFGCGSEDLIVLVPLDVFLQWLPNLNMTVKEGRRYWHVQMYEERTALSLVQKGGLPRIDLASYTLRNGQT